jgi:hypothetical protein
LLARLAHYLAQFAAMSARNSLDFALARCLRSQAIMRRSLTGALISISLSLLAVPGCGGAASQGSAGGGQSGSTTTGGASTTGGRATTGGTTMTAGQGQGGTAGEGKPPIDACDRSIDCALKSPGCCGACEPVQISDLIAVNVAHLSDGACDVACGPCPPLPEGEHETRGYFLAGCVEHKCTVIDVRETELVSCTTDSECGLRLGAACCAACTGKPIAVNESANFCPDGAQPCLACLPLIPLGYASSCVTGRCTLSASPAP